MRSYRSRRTFLKQTVGLGLSAGLAGCTWAAEKQQAVKPNFVFILVDDLGWADLACYGNPLHETPHVDGLFKDGMHFTQAYAACAVCSPTRASIQTGQYPVRMGITDWIPGARKKNMPLVEPFTEKQLPLEQVTIAEALKQGGYQTAIIGKWHLGNGAAFSPAAQGYDVVAADEKGGGYFPDGPDGDYLTDRLGDAAVGLLEGYSRDRQQPFFMMMSFYTVHTPIQPKPALKQKYERKMKQLADKRWTNAGYAGMVQSMDENVGKILDALKRLGLEEDTVVIFTSDNGGLTAHEITTNDPLSLGKGYYHEGGVRVPTIVRWPSVTQAGSVNDCPIMSTDYYPTLLQMTGLALMPDQHKDGLSLVPLLKGGTALERDTFYWHYPHYHGAGETPCSAIRAGDYKFIRHYEDDRRELYHIPADIGETKNLIAQQPEKAKAMEAKLDAWLKEVNAVIPKRK